jgi:hypothetical protein
MPATRFRDQQKISGALCRIVAVTASSSRMLLIF